MQVIHPYKQEIIAHFDQYAPLRSASFRRNRLYHQQLIDVCRPFMNADTRLLEVGCSAGDLLAELKPAAGVGIDFSPKSIEMARSTHPHYQWLVADAESLPDDEALKQPFDMVVAADVAPYLYDIQVFLENMRGYMHDRSRMVISTWNWMWQPILRVGEQVGAKIPDLDMRMNWLSPAALANLLKLSGYAVVKQEPGILFPYQVPLFTSAINSLSYTPLLSRFALHTVLVARPLFEIPSQKSYSVSVIIPTRNEKGNIAALVERTPEMGSHTELVFVDGNSTDGTVEEIQRQMVLHPERDITFVPQVAPLSDGTPPNLMLKLGKGDAVRKGFARAKGDILMILDSDISVAPEDMTRFYDTLAQGHARFANGTRFIYEFESAAMKSLNRLGNVFFSLTFSWLLGQRITDTLCGTKVLFRTDYQRIVANRSHFGDFDPFGDFDLIFGAAWLGLPIKDVPVRYLARTYGESKVRVSKHGPLLGRMALIALWHFKIRPLVSDTKQAAVTSDSEGTPQPAADNTSSLWAIASLALLAFLLWWWQRPNRRDV